METLKLTFELRNSFKQIYGLFRVLNKMTLVGTAREILVDVESFIESNHTNGYYISVNVHRCKNSFFSIELKRDLNHLNDSFTSQLSKLRKLQKVEKKSIPFFKVDDTFKNVTIFFFDSHLEYEKFYNDNTSFVSLYQESSNVLGVSNSDTYNEYLNLDFKTRKPFDELGEILIIANEMLNKDALLYTTIRTPCSSCKKGRLEGNCIRCNPYAYLTFNIYYEQIKRSSLNITASLKGKFTLSSFFEHHSKLTRFAFACSNLKKREIVLTCQKDANSNIQHIYAILKTNLDSEEKKNMDKLLKSISPE
ncbi:hypothetical protein D3C72_887000 [compost metagenome]